MNRLVLLPRRLQSTTTIRVVPRPSLSKSKPKTAPKQKDPIDEKPWPRSVLLSAAAVASVAIPYFTLWFVSGNERLRRQFIEESIWEESIRKHYGNANGQLPGEYTTAIERDTERTTVKRLQQPVTVRLFDTVGRGEEAIEKTRTELPGMASVQSVGVAMDFPDHKDEEQHPHEAQQVDTPTTTDDDNGDRYGLPLLTAVHTYSPWYFHHQHQQQAASSHTKNSISSTMHQAEVERLQYSVAQLQNELLAGSHRSIDDIEADLHRTQSELRHLSSSRWWPW